MRGRILVVEDIPEMAELIKDNLEFEGFGTQLAGSAEAGFAAIAADRFDLIILDLNLPGMDGFEFLERLRRDDATPVLIVSARGSDEDVVRGLGIGADEYLQKPFSPKGLVARARAIIRRSREYGATAQREVMRLGSYEIDLEASSVTREGERIALSSREFEVLGCLVRAGGRPLKSEDILATAWDKTYGDLAAVGVYIQRLRRKLEEDPAAPCLIVTDRGFGYRLEGLTTAGGSMFPPKASGLAGV